MLLFNIGQLSPQEEPLDTSSYPPSFAKEASPKSNIQSGIPTSSGPLTATVGFQLLAEKAVLSNDMDHDGNYDGVSNPLVVLGCAFLVVLGRGLVLLVPLVGRIVRRLEEASLVRGSDYYSFLERPG